VLSPRGSRARGVGAAIAVTGLKIALQTGLENLYDTNRRSSRFSGPPIAMDDPRVGNARPGDGRPTAPSGQPGMDSTFDLVERAKSGDREALDRLFSRFLPALRRWASGRLPRWTRDLMDTDDLVQETVLRSVKRMDSFESRHEGALQAYLRQAIMNRIRDEVRRTKRSPMATELDENQTDHSDSPLEMAIGHEALERYEAALARLRPEEREAIVARVEMDGSYQAVAEALGKPSADAARMAVSRALLRLAEEMNRVQV
jgi:RNA polymerase sigma factor (sigma-70 family)